MRRQGQSTIESSLLLATVALLILGGALAIGPPFRHWFEYLVTRIIAGV